MLDSAGIRRNSSKELTAMLSTDDDPSLFKYFMIIAPELLSTYKSPLGDPTSNLSEDDALLINSYRLIILNVPLSSSLSNLRIKT